MRIDVLSLFPEIIHPYLQQGVVGQAVQHNILDVIAWNLRDFTDSKTGRVDDRPYGGGAGMVLQVAPLQRGIQQIKKVSLNPVVIYLSPQGKTLDQAAVCQLSRHSNLLLIAGRYEGIDERLIELEVDQEWSIGDYVLSGGELPALVMIDAIARLLPGVLGDSESAKQDSYMNGLLDYPHYTRPRTIAGLSVPEVLLNGHHQQIMQWRWQQALGRTWLRRPDLFVQRVLEPMEQQLLEEFKRQYKHKTNSI